MANWPSYCVKVKGNSYKIEEIEQILREQTRWLHLEINEGYDSKEDSEYTTMEISGATAWGVHDLGKIVDLVVKNKMDLVFRQSDIQADTKCYGEWKNGIEMKWEEGPYDPKLYNLTGEEPYDPSEKEFIKPSEDDIIPF